TVHDTRVCCSARMSCTDMCNQTASLSLFFFFNDTAPTEIYTLSLHDALPIYGYTGEGQMVQGFPLLGGLKDARRFPECSFVNGIDRKSTRLNSSHLGISYAVFCLKKKKIHPIILTP